MKKFLFLAMLGIFFTVGTGAAHAQSKILVAYSSRTGEEYSVGNITKGTRKLLRKLSRRKSAEIYLKLKL